MNKSLSLQKYLQKSVDDSRREIRKNILDGMVKINFIINTDPQTLVLDIKDTVHYKNKITKLKLNYHYYILNKPKNIITSLSDPQGRRTIQDLIGKIRERVYPVGRLDYKSEGLILLTNDGDLTNFIISPRNKIPKTYLVKLSGDIKESQLITLEKKGIFIENRTIIPLKVKKLNNSRKPKVIIQLVEGKKHIVRKIFRYCGFPVMELKRLTIGTFKLAKLPSGRYRKLTQEDIATFKREFNYPSSNK
jgi:pseudouridine synthase